MNTPPPHDVFFAGMALLEAQNDNRLARLQAQMIQMLGLDLATKIQVKAHIPGTNAWINTYADGIQYLCDGGRYQQKADEIRTVGEFTYVIEHGPNHTVTVSFIYGAYKTAKFETESPDITTKVEFGQA